MELPNTSSQAIELDPSCSGQAHSNRLAGTAAGYENKEPGCILAVLHVSSIVRPLRSEDTMSGKVL